MSLSTPYILSFIAEIYDSSYIKLYWDGIYNNVSLQKSNTGEDTYITFATDISSDSYNIYNLTENIDYFFRITPYDISGNTGKSLITNIFFNYKLIITSFYTGKTSATSIRLYWTGNYYSVNIQYKLYAYDDTAYSDPITLVGKNTYIYFNLVENTKYTFKITPKYSSGIASSTSYTVNGTTETISYFSSFILKSVSATTVILNWIGECHIIKFKYSTTNIDYKTFSIIQNEIGDISGTVIFSGLTPNTTYYFIAVPYDDQFNIGIQSDVLTVQTIAGITSFYASNITQTEITLNWDGLYTTVDLYKSTDGGYTYPYLLKSFSITDTKSYTDTDVYTNTDYYYYLQPHNGEKTILYVLSDYYAQISATIQSVDTNSITININTDDSLFKKALIQLSLDGINYYDALTVYQSGLSYKITSSDLNSVLTENTLYYVMITPYSLYDISGTSPFKSNTVTIGSITEFDLSVNSSTSIYLYWDGYFTNSRIEYSLDSNFLTNISSIYVYDVSYYTISSLDTINTTYYYRVIPINSNEIDGSESSILYNPTINTIYYNNISSSYATVNWSGINTYTTLQKSTTGIENSFIDVSGYIKTTDTSANILLSGTTVYTRIIPYYGNIIGATSNTVYVPYTNGLQISSITSSPDTITLKIKDGGVYGNVKLQYTTSSTSTSYIDISTNIVSSTIIVNTSILPSLDTQNTTYYFSLIPYTNNYKYGNTISIAGNTSSSVFNPSISSIYISDISKNTNKITLNWTGTYTIIDLYESSNNIVFTKIFSTNGNVKLSHTPINSLSSYITNYYKIIPSSNDCSGIYSELIYTPTITDLSVSRITGNVYSGYNVRIGWTGNYDSVSIEYSTSPTSNFVVNYSGLISKVQTISDLSASSTAYYFRLIPYVSGKGTASSYKTMGVTSRTIYNPVIKTITISDITTSSLTLNWTGIFGNVTLQSSTDNLTFSNLTAGNIYITGNSKTITTNASSSVNYYRIIPYYKSVVTNEYISGLNSSVVYNPIITNFYIKTITDSSIIAYWTGTYNYVKLQYSKTGETYTDISSVITENNITITSSYITDLSTQFQTYYFRVIPYSTIINTDNTISIITGIKQNTYTPTIQDITIYSITSSSILLSYSGTFNTITIQSSSDGIIFNDLSTNITTNNTTISTIGTITTYYRIKPYNSDTQQVNGIISKIVYIPTLSSLLVDSVTHNPDIINLSWSGIYDKIDIQYSQDNLTFSSLLTNLTGNTTTISSSIISGLNTKTTTYYFRGISYTYGYKNDIKYYDISGLISTSELYNASISNIYTSIPTDNSTNTIQLHYIGIYYYAILYYGISGETTSFSIVNITEPNTGYTRITIITDLSSNTDYLFKIEPYNIDDIVGITSYEYATTISTIYNLNFSYNLSISTAYSIGLSWTNNGYTTVEIYKENGSIPLNTFYMGGNVYYNSLGIETLIPNNSYNYYAKVYDSINNVENTDIITTYTLATVDFLDLSYTNILNNNSITITWTNYGYNTFSIYNYTLYGSDPSSSNIKTITNSSNITTYNSYTDVSDILQYNNSYIYKITLTNLMGEIVNTTITVISLAFANLSISTDTTQFTSLNIPLTISGSYNGFKIYINDDSSGISNFSNYIIYDSSSTTNISVSSLNSIINSANNQYSFKIQPYNNNGVYSDISSSYVSAKTIGNITTFYTYSIQDSSSVILYIDGSYDKVALEKSSTTDFNTDYTSVNLSALHGIYNYNDLKPNTKYYFRVTPINQPLLNGVDILGITVYNDTSGTTFGTITTFKIGEITDISANAIPLIWDGSFALINIYQSTDEINYTNIGTYNTNYTTITELETYTQYYYYGIPINSTELISDISSSIATAQTLGTVTTFYTYSIQDSSSIILYIDGSYDNIVIDTSTTTDFTTDYTSVNLFALHGIYNYNDLKPNTKYYFRVTPITQPLLNGVDISGITVYNDTSGTTFGTITTFKIGAITDISANAIPLIWDGSFALINIYQSTDEINYTNIGTYNTNYTTITELETYTQYYYYGIPINSTELISDISSSIATAQTLGTVTTFYTYSIQDSSSIILYFDGSYDKVALEKSSTTDFTTDYTIYYINSYYNGIYDISGLEPNKKYYFRIQPITYPLLNEIDACGNIVTNDVSGTTDGYINNINIGSISDITNMSIPLLWDGSFSRVYIYYSTNTEPTNYIYDFNNPYTENSAIIYNLNTNIQYYFVIIPENSINIISDICSSIVTAKTLGTITSFYNYSVIDNSSINIYVNGDYESVCLECFGGSSGFISKRIENLNGIYSYNNLDSNTTYTFLATPLVQPLFNGIDISGITVDNNVVGTTWGNITSFYINNTDISSTYIPLIWSGNFTSIYLEYSKNITFNTDVSSYVITNISGITVSNLSSNIQYYFRITPINTIGVYGKTTSIITDYTNGTSAILDISYNNVNSITLNITGGSYKTAVITTSINASMEPYTYLTADLNYEDINNKTYTITDLSANTKYYFSLTPYNANGIKGSTSNIISSTTLGNLTSFELNYDTYNTTSSSIAVKWTGIYANVYLENALNSLNSFSPVGYITDTSYNVQNLLQNTKYYFRATPINTAGNSGITLGENGDISNVTLATINYCKPNIIGDNSVNIIFDGSFNYINLYTDDNIIYQNYSTLIRDTGTDISGLSYFTSYTVYFKPYNLNNVSSDISSFSFTTLPKINSFTILEINTTYIPVTWDGSFNSVKIQWSNTSGSYNNNKYIDTPIKTTNITDLSQNKYYYISIIPYSQIGANGVAGYIYDEISGCTLPQLNNFAINTISTTYYSISLYWDGYYKDVLIEYSTDNLNFILYEYSVDTSVNINSLNANFRYYFRATPFNLVDVSGMSIYDISTVTLGNITNIISYIYDTSVNFVIDGSFSYINIYSTPSSINKTYQYNYESVSTLEDISELIPNTTYIFIMTPINSDGVLRTDTTSTTIITLPKINSFIATEIDSSSVVLIWDGSYTYVLIDKTTIENSYNFSYISSNENSTFVSDLLFNTRYYFNILPVGIEEGYGNILDISFITHSLITNLTVFSYYDTSAVISFDGSFTSIDISINGITTTYTNERDTGLDISGLLPNTTYTVTSTSTNSVNTTIGNTISFTTLPKINDFYSSVIDSSSIFVYWTYTGNAPSSVSLIWNTSGDTYDITDNSGIYTTPSPIYITNLSPNTKYYFQITPNNLLESGYSIKDISNATYATLTSFNSTVYDTSAVISFDGSFTSIDISINGITTTYTNERDTGLDISELIPNTTYIVTNNIKNINGSIIVGNTISFTTLPKINDFYSSVIDSSSIFVYWTYTGNAPSSVSLIWNTSGDTYDITDNSGIYTTPSPIYITNLSANTKYYFQITPNNLLESGYSIKDISNATYATLTLFNSIVYDTSAVIEFDGSYTTIDISYTTIDISYNTTNLIYYDTIKTTGTDISNLLPNANYLFIATVYNQLNLKTIYTYTYYTLPNIITFTSSTIDNSAISIIIDGSFTSVKLQWDTDEIFDITDTSAIITTTKTPYIVNNLNSFYTYYFAATPINTNNINGYIKYTNATTLLDFSGLILFSVLYN